MKKLRIETQEELSKRAKQHSQRIREERKYARKSYRKHEAKRALIAEHTKFTFTLLDIAGIPALNFKFCM